MSRRVAETAAANFAIQGLGAIAGVVVARLLGPDGRGDLAAAMVWPTILGGISILGTDVAFARFAASEPHRLRQVYRAMIAAIGVLSVSVAAIGYYLMPLLLHAKDHLLPIAQAILVVVPASMASAVCANVSLGLGKHYFFNTIRLSYSVSFLALILLVAAFGRSTVLSTALCFVAAAYVAAGYGVVAMRGQMSSREGPPLDAREVAVSAAPFGLVTIAQAIIANLPVAILAAIATSENVGYFVVAMVAGAAHASLGSAVAKILFAKVASGDADANAWISSVFRQSVLLYVLLAISLAFALPYLIPLLFGEGFRYSGHLAIGLVFATSFSSLASVLEEFLRARGIASRILFAQMAGAVSLLIVALVLFPRLGLPAMIGACIVGAMIHFAVILRAVATNAGIGACDLIAVGKQDWVALVKRARSMLSRS